MSKKQRIAELERRVAELEAGLLVGSPPTEPVYWPAQWRRDPTLTGGRAVTTDAHIVWGNAHGDPIISGAN